MYPTLLTIHSLMRWAVLATLLYTIYRGLLGWARQKPFTRIDRGILQATVSIAQIQFLLGLGLYFMSPLIRYFYHHFNDAVHQREIRFFGMEHIVMMFIAIAVISTCNTKVKRSSNDQQRFKTMALWLIGGLLCILIAIPWSFSPLVSRPLFRPF